MQQSVNTHKSKRTMSTRVIAQIGILAAISYFLRFLEVPLPIFPSFLKLDLSDIVAVFGGLSMGPVAGFIVVVIKNLLQAVSGSTTGGVGEIANVLIAGPYVLMVCFICRKAKLIKCINRWCFRNNTYGDSRCSSRLLHSIPIIRISNANGCNNKHGYSIKPQSYRFIHFYDLVSNTV